MNEENYNVADVPWWVIIATCIFLIWLFFTMRNNVLTVLPYPDLTMATSSIAVTPGYNCDSPYVNYMVADKKECDAAILSAKKYIQKGRKIEQDWCNAHTAKDLTLEQWRVCQNL